MSRTSPTVTLAPDVVEQLELTVEHLNAGHADTILFIVRGAADLPLATSAELVAIDATGVDAEAVVDQRRTRARVRFGRTLTDATEIQAELLGILHTARAAAADDEPLTSLERELIETATLPTFVTAVIERRRLTPHLCEIVLGGGLDELTTFGADQFVYVITPRRGGRSIPDGYTMAAHQSEGGDDAPHGAYYTVRRWDPDRGRLTLWVVLHGHRDGVGAWAASCTAGDRVAIWGPRHGSGSSPRPGPRLLVADESGFAAVAALLDELPDASPTTVIVETIDRAHELDLPRVDRADIDVIWLHRGTDEPGTGTRIIDAIRDLDLDPTTLMAFGALESRQATAIRRHLRHEVGVPADRVSVTGYWRR